MQTWNPQRMKSDYILICLFVCVQNFLREMNNWVHRKRQGGVLTLLTILGQRSPDFNNIVLSSSEKEKGSLLFIFADRSLCRVEDDQLSSGSLHHTGDHCAIHDMHCTVD